MRVARLHAWGDVRVEEMARPAAGAGEVVIRVDACGLCGSDALEWYVAKKAPVVLGHEPVGTVVEAGADVTSVREGERVFVHHHAPCMSCAQCERRLWSNCATWRVNQLSPGGFAEYVKVGAQSVAYDVLVLPDTLDDETATFIEPVACCLRALDKTRLGAGDRVVIIGLGAMGLLLGQLARMRGATVEGVDPVATRREIAEELGIATSHRSDGGGDVVIITPGTEGAVAAGLAAAAAGGRVVCFTPIDPARPLRIDQAALYFREIELLQSYSCGPDETRAALELLAARGIETAPLVTHRTGLGGVATALERMHSLDGIKTVVYPHGGRLQERSAAP